MVKFTVQNMGEHTIDNMMVSGPFRSIIMEMADIFLATCTGPTRPDEKDLDYQFAEYIIKMSYGQGRILEWSPNPPEPIH